MKICIFELFAEHPYEVKRGAVFFYYIAMIGIKLKNVIYYIEKWSLKYWKQQPYWPWRSIIDSVHNVSVIIALTTFGNAAIYDKHLSGCGIIVLYGVQNENFDKIVFSSFFSFPNNFCYKCYWKKIFWSEVEDGNLSWYIGKTHFPKIGKIELYENHSPSALVCRKLC